MGVPGSVLWLLEGNAVSHRNIRREAADAGINSHRIVIRCPESQHNSNHDSSHGCVPDFSRSGCLLCSIPRLLARVCWTQTCVSV